MLGVSIQSAGSLHICLHTHTHTHTHTHAHPLCWFSHSHGKRDPLSLQRSIPLRRRRICQETREKMPTSHLIRRLSMAILRGGRGCSFGALWGQPWILASAPVTDIGLPSFFARFVLSQLYNSCIEKRWGGGGFTTEISSFKERDPYSDSLHDWLNMAGDWIGLQQWRNFEALRRTSSTLTTTSSSLKAQPRPQNQQQQQQQHSWFLCSGLIVSWLLLAVASHDEQS